MEDEETIEKQQYLRTNILEKGYNDEEFSSYLFQLKGEEGLDIQNWSKDELIKVVQEFKRQKENMNLNNVIIEDKNNKDNKSENNCNINNKNNKNNNKTNNSNIKQKNTDNANKNKSEHNCSISNKKEIGPYYLKCRISEKTYLSTSDNIEIIISNPKIMKDGLFSFSYITYSVETRPLNFNVIRTVSDFKWLHDILKKVYINCVIPPISFKEHWSAYTDKEIYKKMNLFQTFMIKLIKHPLLRNSQILYDFLYIEQEKIFAEKKIIYDKILPPSRAEEIKTNEGYLKIPINKEKKIYANNIEELSKTLETFLPNITKEYKMLCYLKKDVITKMKDISSLWKELYKISQKYFLPEKKRKFYDSMGILMEILANIEDNQINLINVEIRENLRYLKNEYISLGEYKSILNNLENQYSSANKALTAKKEKLFRRRYPEEWKLSKEDISNKDNLLHNKNLALSKMLPEETGKVNEYRNIYGCYLNSLIKEYDRIR